MSSQSGENYLESIYELLEKRDKVRIIDISKHLDIKPPSVIEMVQKLEAERLITYEKHRGAKLTSKGEKIAKSIKQKHGTLVYFLNLLGLSKNIAERDACKIEHIIHPITAEKLVKFVGFVSSAPKKPKWLRHYEHYCKTGEHLCEEKI